MDFMNTRNDNEPLIECQNLALGYDGVTLLDAVNLSVGRGVFLPFVGPNGAGKTTLLRAILGLIPPLRGSIRTPFRTIPPGYVSQQKTIDPLYPVSALDIVMMGAYPAMGWLGRRNCGVCLERAERLLTRFGLAEHRHKTFGQLSGGMRQKALVARALAGDPAVLIMDEPTTELDSRAQRDVLAMLRHSAEHEGRTVLMVHHGLELIAGMAREVCLVHDGQARIVPMEDANF